MKKGVLLNADISAIVACLGHTDTLVVCDAGLPISSSCQRIDLALTEGLPSFMQVLSVVCDEMQVEGAILAQEIKMYNLDLHTAIIEFLEMLGQRQGNTIEICYVSHDHFKKTSTESRAVIRSGECSPYANIILRAGVTF